MATNKDNGYDGIDLTAQESIDPKTGRVMKWKRAPRNMGNLSLWDNSIPERAYKLSLLGLTEEQISVAFGISPRTLTRWKQQHPALGRAITLGGREADAHVAKALYKRATGYKTTKVSVNVVDKKVVKTEYEEEVAPDTTAAIFWLKNRQKEKWADVWKVDHTHTIAFQLPQNDVSDISVEELTVMKDMAIQKSDLLKQLQQSTDN